MKSIDIVIKEHHIIRQYLDVLTQAKEKLEKGGQPQVVFFKHAIEF